MSRKSESEVWRPYAVLNADLDSAITEYCLVNNMTRARFAEKAHVSLGTLNKIKLGHGVTAAVYFSLVYALGGDPGTYVAPNGEPPEAA